MPCPFLPSHQRECACPVHFSITVSKLQSRTRSNPKAFWYRRPAAIITNITNATGCVKPPSFGARTLVMPNIRDSGSGISGSRRLRLVSLSSPMRTTLSRRKTRRTPARTGPIPLVQGLSLGRRSPLLFMLRRSREPVSVLTENASNVRREHGVTVGPTGCKVM